jgi:signal transduction histidine kinase
VIQGCTSISALLEAVSSLQREDHTPEKDLLDYARSQVRTTIDEARQAVWNLRHDDEPLQDLSHSIAVIAEHTRKEFGLQVESSTTGRPLPVQGPIARELLMVMREAVYNAALHAREVILTVEDDGTGFNPQAPANDDKHYGIAGMRERMERIHGEMELSSVEGKGTTVLIRLGRSHLMALPAVVGMKV